MSITPETAAQASTIHTSSCPFVRFGKQELAFAKDYQHNREESPYEKQ